MHYLWLALLLPQLSFQLPVASSDSSPHVRSEDVHSFTLTRTVKRASSSDGITTGKLHDNKALSKYTFPLRVEGKEYNLEIATGSSDTWIAGKDLKCYKKFDNATAAFSGAEDQKICKYDAKYKPGKGFAFQQDIYFQDCYNVTETSDECVRGVLGYADVKIGDITVKQLIGVANDSSYVAKGDRQSGVLGLGRPGLTNIYNTAGNRVTYPPLMYTIFNSNSSKPLKAKQFSLALSRDHGKGHHGGIFTIGGLPSLTDQNVNVSSTTPSTAPWTDPLGYYGISVDGFVTGSSSVSGNLSVRIASGVDVIQVPQATATSLNALWSPAIAADGKLSCKATLTQEIGISIGGTTYYMMAEDLMEKRDDGKCHSLIEGTDGSKGYRIGDPFLRNVLAVFDWDNQAMQFYPRQYYKV